MTNKVVIYFCTFLLASIAYSHRIPGGIEDLQSLINGLRTKSEKQGTLHWLKCVMDKCAILPEGSELQNICKQICKKATTVPFMNNPEASLDPYLCNDVYCSSYILKRNQHNDDKALGNLQDFLYALSLKSQHKLNGQEKSSNIRVNDGTENYFEKLFCRDKCRRDNFEDYLSCFERECADNFNGVRDTMRGNLRKISKKWVPRVSCLEANCDQYKNDREGLFSCGVQMCGGED